MTTWKEAFTHAGLDAQEWGKDWSSIVMQHWSGLTISLRFSLDVIPPALTALSHVLPSFIARLDPDFVVYRKKVLADYQESVEFMENFCEWIRERVSPESEAQYVSAVQAYIRGYEPGRIWEPSQLTDAVPEEIRKRVTSAFAAKALWYDCMGQSDVEALFHHDEQGYITCKIQSGSEAKRATV